MKRLGYCLSFLCGVLALGGFVGCKQETPSEKTKTSGNAVVEVNLSSNSWSTFSAGFSLNKLMVVNLYKFADGKAMARRRKSAHIASA